MVIEPKNDFLTGFGAIKKFKSFCHNHGEQEFIQIFDNPAECQVCQNERLQKETEQAQKDFVKNLKQQAMIDNGIVEKTNLSDWQYDENQLERQHQLLINLENYAKSFCHQSPNILLIGNTGTGKTHLCNGVAKMIFQKLYKVGKSPARITKTANITRRIKDSWGDKSKLGEHEILAELADIDFLVLDDLGDGDSVGGDGGANDRLRFGQLIDSRYQKAPTVITTNMSMPKVKEFLGDRAWDRFSQNMIFIECNWQSYRQRIANVQNW